MNCLNRFNHLSLQEIKNEILRIEYELEEYNQNRKDYEKLEEAGIINLDNFELYYIRIFGGDNYHVTRHYLNLKDDLKKLKKAYELCELHEYIKG